jgi:hypothetical protein
MMVLVLTPVDTMGMPKTRIYPEPVTKLMPTFVADSESWHITKIVNKGPVATTKDKVALIYKFLREIVILIS